MIGFITIVLEVVPFSKI